MLNPSEISDIAAETAGRLLVRPRQGVPEARVIRRELSARLKSESGPDVVAVGLAIVRTPALKASRARWVGWELISRHKAALASLDLAMVEALGAGNDTWDELDGFGTCIAGPAWLLGLIRDEDVLAWTLSDDLWRRRTALVATVVLNSRTHGGPGDMARTFAVTDRLLDDREDMVVKAMSWALRKLSGRDRPAVEAYMAANQARLAARVRREVGVKLRTGRKTARPPGPPGPPPAS